MKDEDLMIREDICRELEWEPQVNPAHIGVAVEDGVVTLSGHVSNCAEKFAAEHAARRIRGVRAIVQAIDVRPPESATRPDEAIAASIAQTLEWDELVPHDRILATVEHGIVTLEGTVERAFHRDEAELDVRKIRGVNGVINKITVAPSVARGPSSEEIMYALSRSADLDAGNIKVITANGTVILTGIVRRLGDRQAAERIAWSAPGVREVDNRLSVEAI
jgi:osmotically-inducible protein OsmY